MKGSAYAPEGGAQKSSPMATIAMAGGGHQSVRRLLSKGHPSRHRLGSMLRATHQLGGTADARQVEAYVTPAA